MKLMKKLNQRQEIFCNQIFLGKSATESAIIAGYSKKTAYSIGSALLKNIEITLELARRNAAVQAKLESKKILSKEERMGILTGIATSGFNTPIFPGDATRAIAELNKMDGSYAPEKHAILGDILIEVVYADRDKRKDESPSNVANTPLSPG